MSDGAKICVCPICKGAALEFNNNPGPLGGTYFFPGPKGSEDWHRKKCKTCNGRGRVIYAKGRMIPAPAEGPLPSLEEAIKTISLACPVLKIVGNEKYKGKSVSPKKRRQIEDIYRRAHKGESVERLAEEFGMCKSTIYNIKNHRTHTMITSSIKIGEE